MEKKEIRKNVNKKRKKYPFLSYLSSQIEVSLSLPADITLHYILKELRNATDEKIFLRSYMLF